MAQCAGAGVSSGPRSSRTGDTVQRGEGCSMKHQGAMPRAQVPAATAMALGHGMLSGQWILGREVMPLVHPRKTAGEWSLVAELVNTSHAQSYCSPLVFSFADFCSYFRPAGGLMYPTACLVFLLIISVSLKKDITSLYKPCLHCSQHRK